MIGHDRWAVCNNSSLEIKKDNSIGQPLTVQQFVFFVYYLGGLLQAMKVNLENKYCFQMDVFENVFRQKINFSSTVKRQ